MLMHRKPVNSLSRDFIMSLDSTIKELEDNKKCAGLILGSVSLVNLSIL